MFRVDDIDIIKSNIYDIQDDAMIKYKTTYEPTFEEYKHVQKAILTFISDKKKIIYGGFGQNLLIKVKNKEDAFYKETDTPDIEFYSEEPLKDIMELSNYLYEKEFKHIQATGGIHPNTYKLFVNFINYCDITYLSKSIYDTCPTIIINDLYIAHPHFMLIDCYRVFTDPMTSYWRLDKVFNRLIKLIKHYPLVKPQKVNLKYLTVDKEILDFVRKSIIHNSKLVVIGFYGFNYYYKKVNDTEIDIPFYEAITINILEDSKKIHKILKDKYGSKITTKEFYPYFEFFDRRIDYLYDGKVIFKLYDNNSRCIVNVYSDKKKCYFGTNQLVFLYLLSNYYYLLPINKTLANLYHYMFYNLLEAKNKYLDNYNLTVLDESPFKDFTMDCVGEPVDLIRQSRLNKKKVKKFNYEPRGKEVKIPNFAFENNSGNQISNEKYLVLQK